MSSEPPKQDVGRKLKIKSSKKHTSNKSQDKRDAKAPQSHHSKYETEEERKKRHAMRRAQETPEERAIRKAKNASRDQSSKIKLKDRELDTHKREDSKRRKGAKSNDLQVWSYQDYERVTSEIDWDAVEAKWKEKIASRQPKVQKAIEEDENDPGIDISKSGEDENEGDEGDDDDYRNDPELKDFIVDDDDDDDEEEEQK